MQTNLSLVKGRLVSLIDRLNYVKETIAQSAQRSGRTKEDITLIAVTKTHGADVINEAIDAGVTDIGENKVQEILEKYDSVKPVRWHLIGHLQTNKVKYIVDKVCMIHSVDSLKLLDEIERQCEKQSIDSMDCLIQINISGEDTKSGIEPGQLPEMLEHCESMKHVRVKGLMTILPKGCDNVTQNLLFRNINKIFLDNKGKTYHNVNMECLSMGMSGDFATAIECGATMVRVGSLIFGERSYVCENNKVEE